MTRLTVADLVIIGIKGTVLALDRQSGCEIWRAKLKGGDFTNLTFDGDRIYAATGGELFCLEAASGHVLWNNPLKGLGFGIVAIAASAAAGQSIVNTSAVAAQKRAQDEEAAAAVIITTSAAASG